MTWYYKLRNKTFIFIAFITVFIFFYPLICAEETLYFRDVQSFFYPMKYFLAQSFKSGVMPFWCPLYFCGAPFMSDIQTGVFYLPSLIFLVFSYPLSFNLYIVFHVFLCFCFVCLFIRGIGLSVPAAIFSAIAYSYGGYVLSSINLLNNLTVITWLPAMLWSYTRALTLRSLFYYLLTVLFLCLAILGGEPQLFILSVIVTFFFGLVLCSKNKINIHLFMKYNLIFVTMVIVSLLITVVQWGPTYFDYQNSMRIKGFNFSEATEFSMSWDRLKHLLMPVLFSRSFGSEQSVVNAIFPPHGSIPWLLSIYPGLLLVPLALISIFKKPSRETVFWGCLFLLGVILALGNHTPLYHLVYKILPFFRFPEKFYFLSNIGLVVLAAYGFDRIMFSLMNAGVHTKYILWIIPLILFADLYIAHSNLNLTCKINYYQLSSPFYEPVMRDKELFRVYVDEENFTSRLSANTSINEGQMLFQAIKAANVGIINNINYVDGKTGMELQYQWIMAEILKQPWPERIKLLQLSNVKYIVSAENFENNPDIMKQIRRINPILFEIRNDLPRAWIVGEISPLGAWNLKDYSTRQFNARTSALGPGSVATRHKTPHYQGVDNIIYDKPDRILINVSAIKPGVLVLAESAYPGWRASVNGKPANIIRLNYLFQGVELDSGRQQIIFEYQPPFFMLYLTISIMTLLVFMVILVLETNKFFRNKKTRGKT